VALNIESMEILLLVAAVVAMVVRRLRLPYTVALVLTGAALALGPAHFHVALTRQLIFTAFLPPLIFEAALQIEWPSLRREFALLAVLVTAGVAASAAVVAAGLHGLADWPWTSAIVFGVLISATDPVSVIATFKDTGVRGRLRLLVEAESLLNDGTAAVLFAVALAAIAGGAVSAASIGFGFLTTVLGGVLCGGLVAGGLLLLAGQTDDHLVEITLTVVSAYASFLLAEHFHLSGVLATMTAGILMGNVGSVASFTDRGREAVESFWEYVAFAANSLVFLLIGMSLTRENFAAAWLPILIAIPLILAGRALAVYGCCAAFTRSINSVSLRHQHVLFWGGLRGALALALVLSLPDGIPNPSVLKTVTFAVVAFSVIVQGLTITPLLRRIGDLPVPKST
jgi:CPA1 family monovalent cation:H+ antiporter